MWFLLFFLQSPGKCNDLSDKVKNSPSLNSFNYNLKHRTNRKVPSYFYAGTRQLQIYHARLRMKCSSLNNHLYMRNIVNSPLCRCGNETNSHYIFKCPFYTDARLSLKTAIESLNASFDEPTLLFGNELLFKEVNTSIFFTLSNLHPQNKTILTSTSYTGVKDSSIFVFKETLGLTALQIGLQWTAFIFTVILFLKLNSCNHFFLSDFPSYLHRA